MERVHQENEMFYSDGAYATCDVRELLVEESIHQTIPPWSNAILKRHGNSNNDPLERDE